MEKMIFVLGFVSGFLIISCGGANEAVTPQSPETVVEENSAPPEKQNVQVKGLWGKIDDSIVEDTMQQHFPDFLDCYQYEALEILEEIEGDLSVYLIVGPAGEVTDEIYFEGGTLGSENTQACVIGKMKRIRFQKPIGGYNAKVRYTFPFEAPYNHPKPFDWSDDAKFKADLESHRPEIDACLQGNRRINFIIYIGRGGRVESAGATAESQAGYEAGRCIAKAAKNWTFQNPGKLRPAKAIVQLP